MDFKDALKSKLATILLIGFFVMIILGLFQLVTQKLEVDREIGRLDEKVKEINDENQRLSDLIKYLNTTEYTERAARDKLNLKKEGEHVVLIPENSVAGTEIDSDENTPSNAKQWFNYFFSHAQN